jgi:hypothetical protein
MGGTGTAASQQRLWRRCETGVEMVGDSRWRGEHTRAGQTTNLKPAEVREITGGGDARVAEGI